MEISKATVRAVQQLHKAWAKQLRSKDPVEVSRGIIHVEDEAFMIVGSGIESICISLTQKNVNNRLMLLSAIRPLLLPSLADELNGTLEFGSSVYAPSMQYGRNALLFLESAPAEDHLLGLGPFVMQLSTDVPHCVELALSCLRSVIMSSLSLPKDSAVRNDVLQVLGEVGVNETVLLALQNRKGQAYDGFDDPTTSPLAAILRYLQLCVRKISETIHFSPDTNPLTSPGAVSGMGGPEGFPSPSSSSGPGAGGASFRKKRGGTAPVLGIHAAPTVVGCLEALRIIRVLICAACHPRGTRGVEGSRSYQDYVQGLLPPHIRVRDGQVSIDADAIGKQGGEDPKDLSSPDSDFGERSVFDSFTLDNSFESAHTGNIPTEGLYSPIRMAIAMYLPVILSILQALVTLPSVDLTAATQPLPTYEFMCSLNLPGYKHPTSEVDADKVLAEMLLIHIRTTAAEALADLTWSLGQKLPPTPAPGLFSDETEESSPVARTASGAGTKANVGDSSPLSNSDTTQEDAEKSIYDILTSQVAAAVPGILQALTTGFGVLVSAAQMATVDIMTEKLEVERKRKEALEEVRRQEEEKLRIEAQAAAEAKQQRRGGGSATRSRSKKAKEVVEESPPVVEAPPPPPPIPRISLNIHGRISEFSLPPSKEADILSTITLDLYKTVCTHSLTMLPPSEAETMWSVMRIRHIDYSDGTLGFQDSILSSASRLLNDDLPSPGVGAAHATEKPALATGGNAVGISVQPISLPVGEAVSMSPGAPAPGTPPPKGPIGARLRQQRIFDSLAASLQALARCLSYTSCMPGTGNAQADLAWEYFLIPAVRLFQLPLPSATEALYDLSCGDSPAYAPLTTLRLLCLLLAGICDVKTDSRNFREVLLQEGLPQALLGLMKHPIPVGDVYSQIGLCKGQYMVDDDYDLLILGLDSSHMIDDYTRITKEVEEMRGSVESLLHLLLETPQLPPIDVLPVADIQEVYKTPVQIAGFQWECPLLPSLHSSNLTGSCPSPSGAQDSTTTHAPGTSGTSSPSNPQNPQESRAHPLSVPFRSSSVVQETLQLTAQLLFQQQQQQHQQQGGVSPGASIPKHGKLPDPSNPASGGVEEFEAHLVGNAPLRLLHRSIDPQFWTKKDGSAPEVPTGSALDSLVPGLASGSETGGAPSGPEIPIGSAASATSATSASSAAGANLNTYPAHTGSSKTSVAGASAASKRPGSATSMHSHARSVRLDAGAGASDEYNPYHSHGSGALRTPLGVPKCLYPSSLPGSTAGHYLGTEEIAQLLSAGYPVTATAKGAASGPSSDRSGSDDRTFGSDDTLDTATVLSGLGASESVATGIGRTASVSGVSVGTGAGGASRPGSSSRKKNSSTSAGGKKMPPLPPSAAVSASASSIKLLSSQDSVFDHVVPALPTPGTLARLPLWLPHLAAALYRGSVLPVPEGVVPGTDQTVRLPFAVGSIPLPYWAVRVTRKKGNANRKSVSLKGFQLPSDIDDAASVVPGSPAPVTSAPSSPSFGGVEATPPSKHTGVKGSKMVQKPVKGMAATSPAPSPAKDLASPGAPSQIAGNSLSQTGLSLEALPEALRESLKNEHEAYEALLLHSAQYPVTELLVDRDISAAHALQRDPVLTWSYRVSGLKLLYAYVSSLYRTTTTFRRNNDSVSGVPSNLLAPLIKGRFPALLARILIDACAILVPLSWGMHMLQQSSRTPVVPAALDAGQRKTWWIEQVAKEQKLPPQPLLYEAAVLSTNLLALLLPLHPSVPLFLSEIGPLLVDSLMAFALPGHVLADSTAPGSALRQALQRAYDPHPEEGKQHQLKQGGADGPSEVYKEAWLRFGWIRDPRNGLGTGWFLPWTRGPFRTEFTELRNVALGTLLQAAKADARWRQPLTAFAKALTPPSSSPSDYDDFDGISDDEDITGTSARGKTSEPKCRARYPLPVRPIIATPSAEPVATGAKRSGPAGKDVGKPGSAPKSSRTAAAGGTAAASAAASAAGNGRKGALTAPGSELEGIFASPAPLPPGLPVPGVDWDEWSVSYGERLSLQVLRCTPLLLAALNHPSLAGGYIEVAGAAHAPFGSVPALDLEDVKYRVLAESHQGLALQVSFATEAPEKSNGRGSITAGPGASRGGGGSSSLAMRSRPASSSAGPSGTSFNTNDAIRDSGPFSHPHSSASAGGFAGSRTHAPFGVSETASPYFEGPLILSGPSLRLHVLQVVHRVFTVYKARDRLVFDQLRMLQERFRQIVATAHLPEHILYPTLTPAQAREHAKIQAQAASGGAGGLSSPGAGPASPPRTFRPNVTTSHVPIGLLSQPIDSEPNVPSISASSSPPKPTEEETRTSLTIHTNGLCIGGPTGVLVLGPSDGWSARLHDNPLVEGTSNDYKQCVDYIQAYEPKKYFKYLAIAVEDASGGTPTSQSVTLNVTGSPPSKKQSKSDKASAATTTTLTASDAASAPISHTVPIAVQRKRWMHPFETWIQHLPTPRTFQQEDLACHVPENHPFHTLLQQQHAAKAGLSTSALSPAASYTSPPAIDSASDPNAPPAGASGVPADCILATFSPPVPPVSDSTDAAAGSNAGSGAGSGPGAEVTDAASVAGGLRSPTISNALFPNFAVQNDTYMPLHLIPDSEKQDLLSSAPANGSKGNASRVGGGKDAKDAAGIGFRAGAGAAGADASAMAFAGPFAGPGTTFALELYTLQNLPLLPDAVKLGLGFVPDVYIQDLSAYTPVAWVAGVDAYVLCQQPALHIPANIDLPSVYPPPVPQPVEVAPVPPPTPTNGKGRAPSRSGAGGAGGAKAARKGDAKDASGDTEHAGVRSAKWNLAAYTAKLVTTLPTFAWPLVPEYRSLVHQILTEPEPLDGSYLYEPTEDDIFVEWNTKADEAEENEEAVEATVKPVVASATGASKAGALSPTAKAPASDAKKGTKAGATTSSKLASPMPSVVLDPNAPPVPDPEPAYPSLACEEPPKTPYEAMFRTRSQSPLEPLLQLASEQIRLAYRAAFALSSSTSANSPSSSRATSPTVSPHISPATSPVVSPKASFRLSQQPSHLSAHLSALSSITLLPQDEPLRGSYLQALCSLPPLLLSALQATFFSFAAGALFQPLLETLRHASPAALDTEQFLAAETLVAGAFESHRGLATQSLHSVLTSSELVTQGVLHHTLALLHPPPLPSDVAIPSKQPLSLWVTGVLPAPMPAAYVAAESVPWRSYEDFCKLHPMAVPEDAALVLEAARNAASAEGFGQAAAAPGKGSKLKSVALQDSFFQESPSGSNQSTPLPSPPRSAGSKLQRVPTPPLPHVGMPMSWKTVAYFVCYYIHERKVDPRDLEDDSIAGGTAGEPQAPNQAPSQRRPVVTDQDSLTLSLATPRRVTLPSPARGVFPLSSANSSANSIEEPYTYFWRYGLAFGSAGRFRFSLSLSLLFDMLLGQLHWRSKFWGRRRLPTTRPLNETEIQKCRALPPTVDWSRLPLGVVRVQPPSDETGTEGYVVEEALMGREDPVIPYTLYAAHLWYAQKRQYMLERDRIKRSLHEAQRLGEATGVSSDGAPGMSPNSPQAAPARSKSKSKAEAGGKASAKDAAKEAAAALVQQPLAPAVVSLPLCLLPRDTPEYQASQAQYLPSIWRAYLDRPHWTERVGRTRIDFFHLAVLLDALKALTPPNAGGNEPRSSRSSSSAGGTSLMYATFDVLQKIVQSMVPETPPLLSAVAFPEPEAPPLLMSAFFHLLEGPLPPLLSFGLNSDLPSHPHGATPLMSALVLGNDRLLISLLEAGANPNKRDFFGNPVLKYAFVADSLKGPLAKDWGIRPEIERDRSNALVTLPMATLYSNRLAYLQIFLTERRTILRDSDVMYHSLENYGAGISSYYPLVPTDHSSLLTAGQAQTLTSSKDAFPSASEALSSHNASQEDIQYIEQLEHVFGRSKLRAGPAARQRQLPASALASVALQRLGRRFLFKRRLQHVRTKLRLHPLSHPQIAQCAVPVLLAPSHKVRQRVRLLLEHGARVNVRDSRGNCCLHWVAGGTVLADVPCRAGSIRFLPAYCTPQAPPRTRDETTALLSCLLSSGADVTIRNAQGATALHCALESGRLHVACSLIESGASLTATDRSGCTPIHYAALGRGWGVGPTRSEAETQMEVDATGADKMGPMHPFGEETKTEALCLPQYQVPYAEWDADFTTAKLRACPGNGHGTQNPYYGSPSSGMHGSGMPRLGSSTNALASVASIATPHQSNELRESSFFGSPPASIHSSPHLHHNVHPSGPMGGAPRGAFAGVLGIGSPHNQEVPEVQLLPQRSRLFFFLALWSAEQLRHEVLQTAFATSDTQSTLARTLFPPLLQALPPPTTSKNRDVHAGAQSVGDLQSIDDPPSTIHFSKTAGFSLQGESGMQAKRNQQLAEEMEMAKREYNTSTVLLFDISSQVLRTPNKFGICPIHVLAGAPLDGIVVPTITAVPKSEANANTNAQQSAPTNANPHSSSGSPSSHYFPQPEPPKQRTHQASYSTAIAGVPVTLTGVHPVLLALASNLDRGRYYTRLLDPWDEQPSAATSTNNAPMYVPAPTPGYTPGYAPGTPSDTMLGSTADRSPARVSVAGVLIRKPSGYDHEDAQEGAVGMSAARPKFVRRRKSHIGGVRGGASVPSSRNKARNHSHNRNRSTSPVSASHKAFSVAEQISRNTAQKLHAASHKGARAVVAGVEKKKASTVPVKPVHGSTNAQGILDALRYEWNRPEPMLTVVAKAGLEAEILQHTACEAAARMDALYTILAMPSTLQETGAVPAPATAGGRPLSAARPSSGRSRTGTGAGTGVENRTEARKQGPHGQRGATVTVATIHGSPRHRAPTHDFGAGNQIAASVSAFPTSAKLTDVAEALVQECATLWADRKALRAREFTSKMHREELVRCARDLLLSTVLHARKLANTIDTVGRTPLHHFMLAWHLPLYQLHALHAFHIPESGPKALLPTGAGGMQSPTPWVVPPDHGVAHGSQSTQQQTPYLPTVSYSLSETDFHTPPVYSTQASPIPSTLHALLNFYSHLWRGLWTFHAATATGQLPTPFVTNPLPRGGWKNGLMHMYCKEIQEIAYAPYHAPVTFMDNFTLPKPGVSILRRTNPLPDAREIGLLLANWYSSGGIKRQKKQKALTRYNNSRVFTPSHKVRIPGTKIGPGEYVQQEDIEANFTSGSTPCMIARASTDEDGGMFAQIAKTGLFGTKEQVAAAIALYQKQLPWLPKETGYSALIQSASWALHSLGLTEIPPMELEKVIMQARYGRMAGDSYPLPTSYPYEPQEEYSAQLDLEQSQGSAY